MYQIYKITELNELLLEKEKILNQTKRELDDLQEYKNLRDEQLQEIKRLEKKVILVRAEHSKKLSQLKAQFLQERNQQQAASDKHINTIAKQASRDAEACLNAHTSKIKEENRSLRHELLLLIRKTRALHEHKSYLQAQKKQLLAEQQYANDLKKLRAAKQQKLLKKQGLMDDESEKNED